MCCLCVDRLPAIILHIDVHAGRLKAGNLGPAIDVTAFDYSAARRRAVTVALDDDGPMRRLAPATAKLITGDVLTRDDGSRPGVAFARGQIGGMRGRRQQCYRAERGERGTTS